jgi:hypothetical protein
MSIEFFSELFKRSPILRGLQRIETNFFRVVKKNIFHAKPKSLFLS